MLRGFYLKAEYQSFFHSSMRGSDTLRCRFQDIAPMLRPFPAWTCSMCSITICSTCYLAYPNRPAACPPPPFSEGDQAPCHLCHKSHKGLLMYEEVPVFPWRCEGAEPPSRSGGIFTSVALQQYHLIRGLRRERSEKTQKGVTLVGRVVLPLEKTLVDAVRCGSSSGAAGAAASPSERRKRMRQELRRSKLEEDSPVHASRSKCCVIEGTTLQYVVHNPGATEQCVWCAVNPCASMSDTQPSRIVNEFATQNPASVLPLWSHASGEIYATPSIIPLLVVRVPPSLSSASETILHLTVPIGCYAQTSCRMLELYRWADLISLRTASSNASASSNSNAAASPILSLHVLHRNEPTAATTTTTTAGSSSKEESLLLDSLRGDGAAHRSIAVYGVGSTFQLLEDVAHSSSLSRHHIIRFNAYAYAAQHGGSRTHKDGMTPFSTGSSVWRALEVEEGKRVARSLHGFAEDQLRRRPSNTAQNWGAAPSSQQYPQRLFSSLQSPKAASAVTSSPIDVVNVDELFLSQLSQGRCRTPEPSSTHNHEGTTIVPSTPSPQKLLSSTYRSAMTENRPSTREDGCSASPRPANSVAASPAPRLMHPNLIVSSTPSSAPAATAAAAVAFSTSVNGNSMMQSSSSSSLPSWLMDRLTNRGAKEAYGFPLIKSADGSSTSSSASSEQSLPRAPLRAVFATNGEDSTFHALQSCVAPNTPFWAMRDMIAPLSETLKEKLRGGGGGGGLPTTTSASFFLQSCLTVRTGTVKWTGTAAGGAHAAAPASQAIHLPDVLFVYGLDQLHPQWPIVGHLVTLLHRFPSLRLVASFDDPSWPFSGAPAPLLDAAKFLFVPFQTVLRPKTQELAFAHPGLSRGGGLSVLQTLDGLTSNNNRTASRKLVLPAHETVHRVLQSLPDTFQKQLRMLLQRQLMVGDGTWMTISSLLEYLEQEHQLFLTAPRMQSILLELTSNRLAEYEASKHAMWIPQPHVVLRLLEEVTKKE